ncbi:hypothetical protein EV183_003519 [Coemansia sp. RSA 2336]|nr:hypothetical protein EV183_003519 [Coemansia sp. RSA 2336]
MRFSSSAITFALASMVVASPMPNMAVRDIYQEPPHGGYPVEHGGYPEEHGRYPVEHGGYPGEHGGQGGFPGGPGNGGFPGGPALTPLLNKLGLSTTVNGVKELVDNVLYGVGGLLESNAINGNGGLIELVDNLVKGLLGTSLNLHNTVDALTSILENQVPCLLDTVLPEP